jgi:hypothetical protein
LDWAIGFDATIPNNADMAKLGGSKTEANLKALTGKVQANRRIRYCRLCRKQCPSSVMALA